MKYQKIIIATIGVWMTVITTSAQPLPYQDITLSPYERAKDLCGRLTLEEKASLMMDTSPAIPRLGIPEFHWWNEALHGVARNGKATVFPATIGMAASFNDSLVYNVFTATSDEARAKNTEARHSGKPLKRYQGLSFWTPNINIFRDPRWGRGQETYGEDPYLTTRMGLAAVRGLQGNLSAIDASHPTPYKKLLACAKHFAVHSGPEWNRHKFNIEELSPRDLWETYLPAFKALVQEGHVDEIMCAYQRLDDEPCCGSNQLLQQILREEWGFNGIVTSDCGAIDDFWMPERHGVSANNHEASARAIRAGTDVECGNNYKSLPEAILQGEITEEEIDKSLIRLLKARIELGNLDADSLNKWAQIPMSVVASSEHKNLALQMARESIVLLQNWGNILPLEKQNKGIIVMGPNANDSTMQWANYNGIPTTTVTILDGIRKKLGQDVQYLKGCNHTTRDSIDGHALTDEEILTLTDNAETIIFIGGISPRLEGEEMKVNEPGFKGGDRTNIEMPKVQRDIIALLHKTGKKIILVNCSGSAVALTPEVQNTDAIIQAWYPGEQGGNAVADILFGDYNPCGKLPITFYRSTKDLPDYEDYSMQGRTYRYFKGTPLFPFGYGLSYTSFRIKPLSVSNGKLRVQVTNIGTKAGAEVVQIYSRRIEDTNGPIKTLKGFERVMLQPEESKEITFDLPAMHMLDVWDDSTNTLRELPGTYELLIGNSSKESDLRKFTLDITKKQ